MHNVGDFKIRVLLSLSREASDSLLEANKALPSPDRLSASPTKSLGYVAPDPGHLDAQNCKNARILAVLREAKALAS